MKRFRTTALLLALGVGAAVTAAAGATAGAERAPSAARHSTVAAALPSITSLSATTLPRSGRLVISGAGFGAVQAGGKVRIAGLRALVSRWSDSSITAYVPEGAPVATNPVQVLTTPGASNELPLQVTLRQSAGRLKWRFEVDTDYMLARPATGANGTVYANDNAGRLYALTPGGGLKWLLRGVGGDGLTVGPDGTIYVGNTMEITAVNPNGTVKWTFAQNPGALILLGPTLGPDGNLYAVATEGIGIFSLTPAGTLRWTIPEAYDRAIVTNQELAFGPGPGGSGTQMYFHANNHFVGVDSGGTIRFAVAGSGSQPATGPDGTVYTHNWSPSSGGVLGAYDPAGTLNWTFYVSPNNISTKPDVGPDGTVYVGWNLGSLYALNPTGTQKWRYTENGILNDPVASLLGTLILTGGQPNYGQPGFFDAVNATTGKLLWKANLPLDNGSPIVPFSSSRPRFSTNGKTAYAPTITLGVYDHSFLYAIKTG